jgi:hypothetical protein
MDEQFSKKFSATYPTPVMLALPRRTYRGLKAAKIREIEFLVVSHGKHRIVSISLASR